MIKSVEVPLSGHPDKVCDQIVEAVLDEYLRRDPQSRINLKACGSHGMLMLGGTVDSRADFDASAIIKNVYKEIGFEDELEPFVNVERPSEDLAKTMVNGGVQGTCVVHGYATRETREYLPTSYVYAQALARRLHDARQHDPSLSFLKPDGKVQLTMDGKKIVSIVLSVQHEANIDHKELQTALLDNVVIPVVGSQDGMQIFINAGGTFSRGGLMANAGTSGRKYLADTYGGLLPHGGASFVGRDPLHPSRAGAYMARYVAKQLVKRGAAGNVLVHVVYGIGQSQPVAVQVTGGGGKDLSAQVKEEFDFRPEAIVERFGLRQPMYQSLATFGAFGREGQPWEEVE